MLVSPLDSRSDDSAIGCLLCQVGFQLVKAISRLEVASVKSRSVTDNDLGRVLVGHDDGGLGELGAHRIGVIGHQGLLWHAYVMV